MQVFREAFTSISKFLTYSLSELSLEDIEKFINKLVSIYYDSKKILVLGAGRSGLVGKAFAMRLSHLGFNVYVFGETINPPINPGDALMAISGSGRTRLVVTAAEVAKTLGAIVISITTYPDSPLGRMSDVVIRVPGRTKISGEDDYNIRQLKGIYEPLAPLGTLFEITTLVMLDAVTAELMARLGKTEEDLKLRHANIE
ncbi:MAG: 6-phospho-3-hexuloisomerase [Zestosphaera sp.]